MSDVETRAEAAEDEVALDREVSVSHYPGRDPVTVRTTHLDGEEPSREAGMLAVVRRLAQEGQITLPD